MHVIRVVVGCAVVIAVSTAACGSVRRDSQAPPVHDASGGAPSCGSDGGAPRCTTNQDCPGGYACTGVGCGECTGKCMLLPVACNDATHVVCGCDWTDYGVGDCGVPFRFRHEGRCETLRCSTAADCPPRFRCEGEGCGPGEGTCVRFDRPCTADEVGFCACDGRTIVTSGTCPGVRYRHLGACP